MQRPPRSHVQQAITFSDHRDHIEWSPWSHVPICVIAHATCRDRMNRPSWSQALGTRAPWSSSSSTSTTTWSSRGPSSTSSPPSRPSCRGRAATTTGTRPAAAPARSATCRPATTRRGTAPPTTAASGTRRRRRHASTRWPSSGSKWVGFFVTPSYQYEITLYDRSTLPLPRMFRAGTFSVIYLCV